MTPDSWNYETAADLDLTLSERLKHFPREPDMLVYGTRLLSGALLRTWLCLYHRLAIRGREHIPAGKACVLVANHASHLDTVCLLSALPISRLHRAFPAAAKDYFFESMPRAVLASIVVNALPFNRETNIRQSLALCQRLLETPGNALILFPEGTRSASAELGEFKPGIGLLLAGADTPVVPCYLSGAHAALPKGKIVPRPRKIELTIGTPRSYAHRKRGKDSALEISADLRAAIESLRDSTG
ncbi:MAG TPA: lysophospholipid acyltransferase family protein [Pirellulales bacterium]|nr:lysophospholipid acyltransferase family protein [Pirellulales bacterium]